MGGCFSWSGDQDDGLLANATRKGMGYDLTQKNFDMTQLYNKGEEFDMPGKKPNK